MEEKTMLMNGFVNRFHFIILITLAMFFIVIPVVAEAGLRWCYTDHPDAVFCDDFDQYCCPEYLGCTDGAGLPPGPEYTCEPVPGAGCVKSNGRALEVWVPIPCGARINLHEAVECGVDYDEVQTPPFGAKYPKGDQGHHHVNLGAYANSKYGGMINSVKGTDENPLILEYVLYSDFDKFQHSNNYIELSLVDGVNFIEHRAPTDYIFSERCVYEPDEIDINHPIICQQDVPPDGCPDIATAPHHGSIAVGALAYLDKTPCEAPRYIPSNKKLAVFDGLKWWSLPASFPGSGDFILGTGAAHIRLTLWETTMKVELDFEGAYSYCTMPRDYAGGASAGAFNRLSLGFGMACLIDTGTWTCERETGTDRIYTCIPTTSYSKNHPYYVGPIFDNVALYGGEGEACDVCAPIGACCLSNGGCIDSISAYECEVINGGVWQGMGTECDSLVCCPDPFADADADGDVDQADFGMFQACFTGSGPVSPEPTGKCTCFDRSFWATGDGDVDGDDFLDFEACWSGPTVPANPACDDALHM